MCGIFGFQFRGSATEQPAGRVALTMLEALACRGPDSAGVAVIGPSRGDDGAWMIRVTSAGPSARERAGIPGAAARPNDAGESDDGGQTVRFRLQPDAGVTVDALERALGARRGGPEVLSLGRRLDLVKQVGAPAELESVYGISTWPGPMAIGHTRMSTESRIDLSHSQPFWVHGLPDLATVHNGHVTNYHRLRRCFEERGAVFYTDNDSEVIGMYLRSRMELGRSLPEAMRDSIRDLDGAFSYLVASAEGLGVVRDRFGFKPMMLAETDAFVAAATEEIAIRRAFPGDYRVHEPPPAAALFFPLEQP